MLYSAPSVYSVEKAMQTYARQAMPFIFFFFEGGRFNLQQAADPLYSSATTGCSSLARKIERRAWHFMPIIM